MNFLSNNEFDVIIIGSGGGGLSAASMLAQAGKKVLVMEQHSKVGGYMTNFRRKDFLFETSLHAIDGLDEGSLNRSILKDLGIAHSVKSIKLAPYMYRVAFPDQTMDIPSDPSAYKEQLVKAYPHEAQGIQKLFVTMGLIQQVMDAFSGSTATIIRFILTNPLKMIPFALLGKKSVAQLIRKYIDDPSLFAIFSELSGFAGGPPEKLSALYFAAMWGSYHYYGFHYIEGTSQTISDGLAAVIQANKGTILLNTKAAQIQIKNGIATAVKTLDGREYKTRYVISNSTPEQTFFQMIGKEHLPRKYVSGLEKMTVGPSLFVAYLGVDRDYSECFPNGIHEIMVNETYDHTERFDFSCQRDFQKISFMLTNYSVIDPTVAPKGKSVICLTALMTYSEEEAELKQSNYKDYRAQKESNARILIQRSEKFLPELSKHIEVLEVGTPSTMVRYTGNVGGTYIGWENTPQQSILARLPQTTPIKNLMLAGAWTFPGAGQMCVLISGMLAAERIIKKDSK